MLSGLASKRIAPSLFYVIGGLDSKEFHPEGRFHHQELCHATMFEFTVLYPSSYTGQGQSFDLI